MLNNSIDLLAEIDNYSKVHSLQRNDIDELMIEFAKRILATLRLERMSVWLFDQKKETIVCIGHYELVKHNFTKGEILHKHRYPAYFKAISENEIVLVENVYKSSITKELSEDYFKPKNIISLMDIPMRMEGELIGIMCFEKEGTTERIFNTNERVFALSLGIVFASNMEARHRRALQHKLDLELKEKNMLIKEIHHRVKNNLAVVMGLMNLQSTKSKDQFHSNLFSECKTKIHSIADIHELIYKSESFTSIDAQQYFKNLLKNLQKFYSSGAVKTKIEHDIDPILLDIDTITPMALIVNEVITNSYKHAFVDKTKGNINVSLKQNGTTVSLKIKDNGKGFDETQLNKDSLGVEIIKSLSQQLSAKYQFENDNGTVFKLSFDVAAQQFS